MTELRMEIPGPPVPWQRARPRKGAKGFVNPEAMRRYYRHVQACAQAEIMRSVRGRWDMDAVYELELYVYFPDRKVRDDDNVEKAIKDALSGILWRDDNWTRFERTTRVPRLDRERPRVEVVVRAKTADREAV